MYACFISSMDRTNKQRDNHLKIAYVIFRIAPESIINHINRSYQGGLLLAIKDNKEILKGCLKPEDFRLVCQTEGKIVSNSYKQTFCEGFQ